MPPTSRRRQGEKAGKAVALSLASPCPLQAKPTGGAAISSREGEKEDAGGRARGRTRITAGSLLMLRTTVEYPCSTTVQWRCRNYTLSSFSVPPSACYLSVSFSLLLRSFSSPRSLFPLFVGLYLQGMFHTLSELVKGGIHSLCNSV